MPIEDEPVYSEPSLTDKYRDPVAETTDWTSFSRGGSNFKTNTMVQHYGGQRIEYTASWATIFFIGLIFSVMPIFTWLMIEPNIRHGGFRLNDHTIGPLLVCITICGIAAFALLEITQKRVFDKHVGYYWRGRTAPTEASDPSRVSDAVKLTDIHALQLLREVVKSGGHKNRNQAFHSYELNLVLHDGRRVNVIDHGRGDVVQADARILSDFLNVPVWDAIGPSNMRS